MFKTLSILLLLIFVTFSLSTTLKSEPFQQTDSAFVSIKELQNYHPVLVCNLTTEEQNMRVNDGIINVYLESLLVSGINALYSFSFSGLFQSI